MAQFEQLEQVVDGPAAEGARTGAGPVIGRMRSFRPSAGRGEDGIAVFHGVCLAVLDTQAGAVGGLLMMLEERIGEDLMPGPERREVTDPLTHLVGSWNLERACAASWSAARVLWRLRDVPSLAAEFGQRLDAGAGLVGRCLLTPCH